MNQVIEVLNRALKPRLAIGWNLQFVFALLGILLSSPACSRHSHDTTARRAESHLTPTERAPQQLPAQSSTESRARMAQAEKHDAAPARIIKSCPLPPPGEKHVCAG